MDTRTAPTTRRPGARPASEPGFAALVLGGAVAAGVLTAYAQGWLPDAFGSLANSAGGWMLVAVGLALRAPTRRAAVAGAAVAFVAMVLGYVLGAAIRGYASSQSLLVFWSLAGVVVGPPLGLATWWLQHERGARAGLAAGVVAGPAVGEAVYGLTVVAETTGAGWWVVQLVLGLGVLAWALARRLHTGGERALAVGSTVLVGAALWLAYTFALSALFTAVG